MPHCTRIHGEKQTREFSSSKGGQNLAPPSTKANLFLNGEKIKINCKHETRQEEKRRGEKGGGERREEETKCFSLWEMDDLGK